MIRPNPRDADALPSVISSLKAQIAALASRKFVQFGKRWRIQEDRSTGNLIAVSPTGTEPSVILATPQGNAGLTARRLAESLSEHLDYDGNQITVRPSSDAGNTLATGTDGGLFAGGGKSGREPVTFAFTGVGMPLGGPVPLDEIGTGTMDESYPGAVQYPPDPYGYPFRPMNMQTGDEPHWRSAMRSSLQDVILTGDRADPRTDVSLEIPQLSGSDEYRQLEWYIAPYDQFDTPYVRPNWFGDWFKLEMTIWLSGYPTSTSSGYGPPAVSLVRIYPTGHLLLDRSGYLGTASKWFPNYHEAVAWSNDHVPKNRLVNIRMWLSRDGSKDIAYIYYDDPGKADHLWDDWVSFHGQGTAPLVFDDLQGSTPFIEVGPAIKPQWLVAPPDPAPVTTMPRMWMSNVSLTVDPPDPVYWPPYPPPELGFIRGIVTKAGVPLGGAEVALYRPADPGRIVRSFITWNAPGNAEDGTFTFSDLSYETWLIRVIAPEVSPFLPPIVLAPPDDWDTIYTIDLP